MNVGGRLRRAEHVKLWTKFELQAITDEIDLDTRLALQRIAALERRVKEGRWPGLEGHRVTGLRARDDHASISLDWWRRALRETGARRSGRDYARAVRDHALATGLIADSGEHDSPNGPGRCKPTSARFRWWPTFLIVPLLRVGFGSYGQVIVPPVDLPSVKGEVPAFLLRRFSLWRFTIRQGRPATPKLARRAHLGSVQAAFAATGPP